MSDRMRELNAENLAPAVEHLRETALEAAATARERWAEGSTWVRNYTLREPAKALGVALGMGVFVGWLIKRR